MDRAQDNSGAAELGIDAIDRIGVSAIARALGISKQAVRKWRRRGSIPEDRQGDIRRLLETLPEQVSAVARVAEVSEVVKTVPPAPEGATTPSDEDGGTGLSSTQALAVMPAVRPRLEQIAGKHAQRSMSLLITARDVDQARLVVDRAAADAAGLPPRYPVRAYRTRLAILFALDFPILTMAFVAVTQVSPIIAAGSAIALSLGLVLAAHAAGTRLRDLARHLPSWVRDLAALASSEIQRFDWAALHLDQWTAILGTAQRYPARQGDARRSHRRRQFFQSCEPERNASQCDQPDVPAPRWHRQQSGASTRSRGTDWSGPMISAPSPREASVP
jgi:hypothetical protein